MRGSVAAGPLVALQCPMAALWDFAG